MERVNPLKEIRRNANYSLDRLSIEYGISRQLIINNENGQYANPSPALLDALETICTTEWDAKYLLGQYHRWQHDTRKANYGVLVPQLPNPGYPNPLITHPVVQWAEVSNIPYTRISKLYCVHQGLMNRLKNQANLLTYLPPPFTDALLDSGYSMETIDELESRFQLYKHNMRCLVR